MNPARGVIRRRLIPVPPVIQSVTDRQEGVAKNLVAKSTEWHSESALRRFIV
ncbi:MAG: hypothetical protein RI575_13495 [Balneolaceae bacterium]|nr:hypothetical protein [Balneolaceae bacterium]